jgi:hypothetical protein
MTDKAGQTGSVQVEEHMTFWVDDAVKTFVPSEGKDKGRGRLALQLPQRPQFITQEGMRGFLAAFSAAHVRRGGLELDRRPLQVADDKLMCDALGSGAGSVRIASNNIVTR